VEILLIRAAALLIPAYKVVRPSSCPTGFPHFSKFPMPGYCGIISLCNPYALRFTRKNNNNNRKKRRKEREKEKKERRVWR